MSTLLKIYRFPEGFASNWVALYENKHFISWRISFHKSIESIRKENKEPYKIDYFLDDEFGQLALECWNGKYEQYIVWSANEEKIETNNKKCSCSIRDLFNFGCKCGGQ